MALAHIQTKQDVDHTYFDIQDGTGKVVGKVVSTNSPPTVVSMADLRSQLAAASTIANLKGILTSLIAVLDSSDATQAVP